MHAEINAVNMEYISDFISPTMHLLYLVGAQ